MIHILVVDDDEKLAHSVSTYLNTNGYMAKGVLSVQSAYEEMHNNMYDLVISDILMPDIDGFEFARTIREINKNIPILFISVRDDLSAKQKAFDIGIDDYMVKPVI